MALSETRSEKRVSRFASFANAYALVHGWASLPRTGTLNFSRCPLGRLIILSLFAAQIGTAAGDAIAPFELAPAGCTMAHCDVTMSDFVNQSVPDGEDIAVVWRRNELPAETAGSGLGLGCSSNGRIAACSFRGARDNVIAYDHVGNRLWTSGDLLTSSAWVSAPMVAADGDVIAVDQFRLVRFGAGGEVRWTTGTPGGTPVSPVITESGTIVLATHLGPISAYDNLTGERIAELTVQAGGNDPWVLDTVNTPAVASNRIYVTMRYQLSGKTDPLNRNWLVAIDVDADNPDRQERMRVAWRHEFTGPTGGSPLLIGDTVYFDGDNAEPGGKPQPRLYAVKDLGEAPVELWSLDFNGYVVASPARDPRGGLWVFPSKKRFGKHFIWRVFPVPEAIGNLIRIDENTGAVLDSIRIGDLLDGPDPSLLFVPTSVMTIAATADGRPVMLLNVTTFNIAQASATPLQTFIIAVDLADSSLIWQLELPVPEGITSGTQFPILEQDGDFRIVFTTHLHGTWAIGQAPAGDQSPSPANDLTFRR